MIFDNFEWLGIRLEDEAWLQGVFEGGDGAKEEEEDEEMAEVPEEVVVPDDEGDVYALPSLPADPTRPLDKYDKVSDEKTKQLRELVTSQSTNEPRVLASFENVRDYIDHRLLSSKPNKKKQVRAYLGIKLPHDMYNIYSPKPSFLSLLGDDCGNHPVPFTNLLVSLRNETKSHSARKRQKVF